MTSMSILCGYYVSHCALLDSASCSWIWVGSKSTQEERMKLMKTSVTFSNAVAMATGRHDAAKDAGAARVAAAGIEVICSHFNVNIATGIFLFV